MELVKQLKPRQRTALKAVVRGATWEEAAREAGVSSRTVFNWRRSKAFEETLREVQRQLMHDAYGDLKSGARIAVATLREVASDSDAPASARIRASVAILETAFKAQQLEEIEERLSQLEEALAVPPDRQLRPCVA